jgi:DNA-binding winged helix-turn-helix (wHTH) protein
VASVGCVYRFGPFELDAARARLFRGAARVPLSDPQAAILLKLISHVGEVVPKHALADAAWRYASVSDNSVDQAISRLRKTLGRRDDGARYIETVYAGGYRFGAAIERARRRERDAPLDAHLAPFRACVQAQDDLDTLDQDATSRARRAFEHVLRAAPDYAAAHVGLANACAFEFESTRADVAPAAAALTSTSSLSLAIEHASKGCALAPASAEAWSTLAFVLYLTGDTHDAAAAARKAVDLEPLDWRHALRLSYVCWGEARLRAARHVLKLCPGVALAHWLMATVFIARQAFDAALDVLRDGCAAQDAQALAGETTACFPAVGLHWLRGLALAATGRVEAAIDELTRELDSPHRRHVYARECRANTWYALGALRLRQGRRPGWREDACAAFHEALKAVRGHAGAAAALGLDPRPALALSDVEGPRRSDAGAIHLAMAQAIALARAGRHRDAAGACTGALTQAPPGPAGWLLPVEPMLDPAARPDIWAGTLALLRTRGF